MDGDRVVETYVKSGDQLRRTCDEAQAEPMPRSLQPAPPLVSRETPVTKVSYGPMCRVITRFLERGEIYPDTPEPSAQSLKDVSLVPSHRMPLVYPRVRRLDSHPGLGVAERISD